MPEKLEDLLKRVEKSKKQRKKELNFWHFLYKFSFIGLLVLLPLLSSAFLGNLFIKKYSLPSYFFLFFILAGLLLSFYNLWYLFWRKKSD
ncbi:AtpZ/AtpI family protein [Caldimicrobium thiodismutans]|jgi:uncharacterized membrane protein|uniref:AtpZ/AtpI family protein n=1 Tax=Caldimicrobium thiodismutans TaxID=1653476 RepID=UPI000839A309